MVSTNPLSTPKLDFDTEVFSTPHGCVTQCNRSKRLMVSFEGREQTYKISCFTHFRKKLAEIDLEYILQNPDKSCDLTVISPCECDACYCLNPLQLARLKELLEGAQVMLELNSILYARLYAAYATF